MRLVLFSLLLLSTFASGSTKLASLDAPRVVLRMIVYSSEEKDIPNRTVPILWSITRHVRPVEQHPDLVKVICELRLQFVPTDHMGGPRHDEHGRQLIGVLTYDEQWLPVTLWYSRAELSRRIREAFRSDQPFCELTRDILLED